MPCGLPNSLLLNINRLSDGVLDGLLEIFFEGLLDRVIGLTGFVLRFTAD